MKKFSSLVSVVAFCIVPGVFGMQVENPGPDRDSIVQKARGILKNVRIIDENTKRMSTNPVVLLGATGSGKTSLLHILVGTTMKASKSDEAASLFDRGSLIPSENAADRIGKVAGGGSSVTSGVYPWER